MRAIIDVSEITNESSKSVELTSYHSHSEDKLFFGYNGINVFYIDLTSGVLFLCDISQKEKDHLNDAGINLRQQDNEHKIFYLPIARVLGSPDSPFDKLF